MLLVHVHLQEDIFWGMYPFWITVLDICETDRIVITDIEIDDNNIQYTSSTTELHLLECC